MSFAKPRVWRHQKPIEGNNHNLEDTSWTKIATYEEHGLHRQTPSRVGLNRDCHFEASTTTSCQPQGVGIFLKKSLNASSSQLQEPRASSLRGQLISFWSQIFLEDHPSGCKWLITMLSFRPLRTGFFPFHSWPFYGLGQWGWNPITTYVHPLG